MAKPWAEVAASPDFQGLDPEAQESARQLYFTQNVAPNVAPQALRQTRIEFDADTKPTIRNIEADAREFGGISEPSLARRVAGPVVRAFSVPEGEQPTIPSQVPLTIFGRLGEGAEAVGGEAASRLAQAFPNMPAAIPAAIGTVTGEALDPRNYMVPGASRVAPKLAGAPEAAVKLPSALKRLLTPKEGAFYNVFDPRSIGEQAQGLAAMGRGVARSGPGVKAAEIVRKVGESTPAQAAQFIGQNAVKSGKFVFGGLKDLATEGIPKALENLGTGAMDVVEGADDFARALPQVPRRVGSFLESKREIFGPPESGIIKGVGLEGNPEVVVPSMGTGAERAALDEAAGLAGELPQKVQGDPTVAERYFEENLGAEGQKYTDPAAYFKANAPETTAEVPVDDVTRRGLGPTQTEDYARGVMQGTPEEQSRFRKEADALLTKHTPETEALWKEAEATAPSEPAPSNMPSGGPRVLEENPLAAQNVAANVKATVDKVEDAMPDPDTSAIETQLNAEGKPLGVGTGGVLNHDLIMPMDQLSPEIEGFTRQTTNKMAEGVDKYREVAKKVAIAIKKDRILPNVSERVQAMKRENLGLAPGSKVWVTNGDLVSLALDGMLNAEELGQLPPQLKRAVQILREADDELARMRGIVGTKKYIPDHFAHVFDDPALRREMLKKGEATLSEDGKFVPTDAYMKKRQGGRGYSLDFERSLTANAKGAYRKAFMEPWQNWMNEKISKLPDTDDGRTLKRHLEFYMDKILGKPGSWERSLDKFYETITPEVLHGWMAKADKSLVNRWVQTHLGVKPFSSGIMPGPGRADEAARAISNSMYLYLLSYNLGTALKNGLQVGNLIAKVGPSKALIGVSSLLTKEGRAAFAATKEMQELEGFMDGFSRLQARKGLMASIEKAGMMPMRGMEWLLRGSAFHAGLYEGAELAKKGLLGAGTKEDIVRYALGLNHDVNFHYDRASTNPYFQNPVMRVVKTLGTFPMLQAGFYKKLATAKNDEKLFGVNASVWRMFLTQGIIVGGGLKAGIDLSDTMGAKNIQIPERIGRKKIPFIGGRTMPVPLAGTGAQLADFYLRGSGPGGQIFGLADPDKVKGKTWGQRAKDVAKMLILGKLGYPGLAMGKGHDLSREMKTGEAQTKPGEAALEAIPVVGKKLAAPRKAAYRIKKGEAVQKYFGLKPESQRKYMKKFEDKK